MRQTHHAVTRMAQRGLNPAELAFVAAHGQAEYRTGVSFPTDKTGGFHPVIQPRDKIASVQEALRTPPKAKYYMRRCSQHGLRSHNDYT